MLNFIFKNKVLKPPLLNTKWRPRWKPQMSDGCGLTVGAPLWLVLFRDESFSFRAENTESIIQLVTR